MTDPDVTRRRFMAHFAGAGLGTTLLPGALWARMQEAGGEQITADMMSDALALAGLEFEEEEREAPVDGAVLAGPRVAEHGEHALAQADEIERVPV